MVNSVTKLAITDGGMREGLLLPGRERERDNTRRSGNNATTCLMVGWCYLGMCKG